MCYKDWGKQSCRAVQILLLIILFPRFTVSVTGIWKPAIPSSGQNYPGMYFKDGGTGEMVQKIKHLLLKHSVQIPIVHSCAQVGMVTCLQSQCSEGVQKMETGSQEQAA